MVLKIDRPEQAHGPSGPKVPVRIDYNVCDATGVCALICPEDVFEHKDNHTRVVNGVACTECWICVDNCVSGAIQIG